MTKEKDHIERDVAGNDHALCPIPYPRQARRQHVRRRTVKHGGDCTSFYVEPRQF
jgi:hypothetical protein